ncbi:MAG: PAS domain S-box protein [Bacteroidota bacterium]
MFGNLLQNVDSPLYNRKWITSLFILFGASWILISDTLVVNLITDSELIDQVQLYKGWFFVLISGLIFYAILNVRDKQLQSTQQFLQSVFDTAEVGLSVTDEQGYYVTVNQSYCNLVGFDRDELIGQNFTIILPQSEHQRASHAYQTFMRSSQALPNQWELKTKQGEILKVLLTASKLETRSGRYQVTSITDITPLKKSAQELQEANQTLNSIIETAPVGILKLNSAGHITDLYNARAEEILGWSKDQIVGFSLPALDRLTQHNLTKMYKTVLQGYPLRGVEIDFLSQDGNPLKLSISAARLDNNEESEIIVTLTDITEKNRVQNEIEKSYQENKILLQEIHHRVKNNLAIISGILQLQMDEVEDSDASTILNITHNRLQSIATVHERLYSSSSLLHIDLEEHVQGLLSQAKSSLTDSTYADYTLNIEEVQLNINQAIPLGLLLNEYFTHSILHAQKKRTPLHIQLHIHKEQHTLYVNFECQDGDSLPTQSSWSMLSLELMKSLLDQLNAEYKFEADRHTHFCFNFSIK